MKNCPYCAEPIQESALKCRYCGSGLQASPLQREWYRASAGKKIAGVCAGLGEAFGIAATPIRIAFVLLTLFSLGTGMILYIVLWVVMPLRDESSIRLDHRGRTLELDETTTQYLDRG
jgi:phage shock protein C